MKYIKLSLPPTKKQLESAQMLIDVAVWRAKIDELIKKKKK